MVFDRIKLVAFVDAQMAFRLRLYDKGLLGFAYSFGVHSTLKPISRPGL
jgi:hypothetical protein